MQPTILLVVITLVSSHHTDMVHLHVKVGSRAIVFICLATIRKLGYLSMMVLAPLAPMGPNCTSYPASG